MQPTEIDQLREIAKKADELFSAEDLWIDGLYAGFIASELRALLKKWKETFENDESNAA